LLVLKSGTDNQEDDFSDVGHEKVQNEFLDVVKHASAFFDGGDD